jgi:WD40 repeat protein
MSTAAAECGGAITAISASPDDRLVVVGGRDIFKTYAVTADGLREVRNLRAGKKRGLDLSASDVRWHPSLPALVASGSTSGAVLVWDVTKPKNAAGHEHTFRHARTVNRVAWHPCVEAWLLTGSQDGSAGLWDARTPPSCAPSARFTTYAYPRRVRAALAAVHLPYGGASFSGGYADAVRDVQWDPFRPFTFAAALEDGSVQAWDARSAAAPLYGFTAHAGPVMALQWHPLLPCVLATGGRDRLAKVWETGGGCGSDDTQRFVDAVRGGRATAAGREDCDGTVLTAAGGGDVVVRQLSTVQTIATVSRLAWRGVVPAVEGSELVPVDDADGDEAEGSAAGAVVCASWTDTAASAASTSSLSTATAARRAVPFQLASCAALLDSEAHVWDIRRPHVPVATFPGHRDVVTGLTWIRRPPLSGEEVAGGDDGAVAATAGALPWLLSAGKDGRLLLHDPARAQRPHRNIRTTNVSLSVSSVAWSHQSLPRDSLWDPPYS